MPAFTGKLGDPRSSPLQLVPGYGSSSTRQGKSLTASMTPSGVLSRNHVYAFLQVSVGFYKAVYRAVRIAVRSQYRATILADTPVAYYRLDQSSGVIYDSSPYGNNGTFSGGVTTNVSGGIGDDNLAMTFDGATGSVQIPKLLPLPTLPISLECWARIDSSSSQGGFVYIGTGNSGSWAIGVGNTSFDDVGSKLIILNELTRWIPTTKTYSVGWHHVVLTLDSLGKPTAYLDGSLAYSDVTAGSGVQPVNRLTIGADFGGRWFGGGVDEVAVYPYALTSQQVLTHYNVGGREIANLISVVRTSS